jgi:hypothetical protein
VAAAVIAAAIILYVWLADGDEEDVETVPADEVETVVEDGAVIPRLDEFEVAGIKLMVA